MSRKCAPFSLPTALRRTISPRGGKRVGFGVYLAAGRRSAVGVSGRSRHLQLERPTRGCDSRVGIGASVHPLTDSVARRSERRAPPMAAQTVDLGHVLGRWVLNEVHRISNTHTGDGRCHRSGRRQSVSMRTSALPPVVNERKARGTVMRVIRCEQRRLKGDQPWSAPVHNNFDTMVCSRSAGSRRGVCDGLSAVLHTCLC
jgi:hypothetical protein